MPLKIGTLLDGRYSITMRIGHGGMAEVYEANDVILKNRVAVKLIREDVMKNPVNLRRFENEATIAASLNHPNIVKVFNNGKYNGVSYIVNELVKGQTLKDILDFRGSLSINEAIDIMCQLTSALYYAHCHKIIHRDVKPDNIFVLPDGSIKLGDFGIATANGMTEDTSSSKDIIGSVHYLAPEISKGKPATVQSDIYAIGVTFFEMITGRVPFDYDSAVSIAVAHIKEKFPSPKKYLPNCPKEVEKIILKATKKDPSERYVTCKGMYDDLKILKDNSKIYEEKKSLLSKIFGFK